MTNNEKQNERVARYLDGEPVELTAEEMAMAREVRLHEQALADGLEAGMAPAALERARRRATAAVAGRRHTQWGLRIGSAVAAAAALLMTINLWSGDSIAPKAQSGDSEFVRMVNEVDSTPNGMLNLMASMSMDKDQLQEQIDNQDAEVAIVSDLY